MNQMMGNMNMNQMGMNNQFMSNFAMDETAMKIKAIIAPYEKKISELEEQIKQKDFEILVLKEKLNYFKNNNQMIMNIQPSMSNQMNMNNNQNWMEQYNIMNNNNLNLGMPNLNNQNMMNINKEEEKIEIIFDYDNKRHTEFCTFNEKVKKVLKRFCKKKGLKFTEHKFFFGGKNQVYDITVAESGLTNKSIIKVIYSGYSNQNSEYEETDSDDDTILITFKTLNSKINSFRINPENSVRTAITKFFIRTGKLDLINKIDKKIAFIYNAKKLENDDETKLSVLFGSNKNPTIMVLDLNNLIGV